MKEITLTKGKVALVDDEDYESLSAYEWYADQKHSGYWYAARTIKDGSHVLMHRQILGLDKWEHHVDHINGNGLDNRRANIRSCTIAQNQWNTGTRKDNSSGHKGVHLDRSSGKFMALIRVNGKRMYLGLFGEIEKAVRAYEEASTKLHGNFARKK